MNCANPADLRGALELAHDMAKAGLLFVPMPVAGREEFRQVSIQAAERMVQMINVAEAEETGEQA